MNEKSCPSPIMHCVVRDDVLPVRGYRVWGAPQRVGVKPPGAFRLILSMQQKSHSKKLPARRASERP